MCDGCEEGWKTGGCVGGAFWLAVTRSPFVVPAKVSHVRISARRFEGGRPYSLHSAFPVHLVQSPESSPSSPIGAGLAGPSSSGVVDDVAFRQLKMDAPRAKLRRFRLHSAIVLSAADHPLEKITDLLPAFCASFVPYDSRSISRISLTIDCEVLKPLPSFDSLTSVCMRRLKSPQVLTRVPARPSRSPTDPGTLLSFMATNTSAVVVEDAGVGEGEILINGML